MSNRRPLIAGNWKMNGLSSDAAALANGITQRLEENTNPAFDILVCPPFTSVGRVSKIADGTALCVGGQTCHDAEKGAHTGDISAAMLVDMGCSYVILGHSERRADHGEADSAVNTKAQAAWKAGMIAIVCVGETEAQRDAGETLNVISTQVSGSVPEGATAANTVIAYEPVWAIGTGRTASQEEAQEVHAFIRKQLRESYGTEADGMRILYGGSMKPGNAKELMALEDVDGGLIGGAALVVDDFMTIAESC
ncbi:MAG: triose-phosphate isomerase [Rhodospirillales bacterium]|jgi:triosephosphate isomerase (TIM)|nr:triose-phosphate isomerase [Rhodospirillales bacterium]